jgi:hypothetical protein
MPLLSAARPRAGLRASKQGKTTATNTPHTKYLGTRINFMAPFLLSSTQTCKVFAWEISLRTSSFFVFIKSPIKSSGRRSCMHLFCHLSTRGPRASPAFRLRCGRSSLWRDAAHVQSQRYYLIGRPPKQPRFHSSPLHPLLSSGLPSHISSIRSVDS